MTLDDGNNVYTAEQIAESLHGSQCVVLAACHGGESAPLGESGEARGLITAILSEDVGAVVACQWPLKISNFAKWLEIFLTRIDQGEDIGLATHSSNLLLKMKGLTLTEWTGMTVFGDGMISLDK